MGNFIKRILILLSVVVLTAAAAKGRQEWLEKKTAETEAFGAVVQVVRNLWGTEEKEAVYARLREDTELPEAYDYRKEGRSVPVVRNLLGLCVSDSS